MCWLTHPPTYPPTRQSTHPLINLLVINPSTKAALLKVKWPPKYKELSYTKPIFADPQSLNILLYSGLTLSLGMSCGVVNKGLVGGRAQYTGRE